MNEAERLLYQKKWRLIDQSTTGLYMDPLQSFGIDDTLCASVGRGLSPATARSWVHRPTVVLGIQDTKLPFLKDGVDYLKSEGYDVIVRNSGGLAVVLDEGILNLTLVFREEEQKIDIHRGYEAMYLLIKEMFQDMNQQIEAKEISASYCPGSYDLSIHDKKFAGISQRRLQNGAAVQIYLCVTGEGSKRAQLLKQFYTIAKKNEQTKLFYPTIDPTVMASLSELLPTPVTINDVMLRLMKTLQGKCHEFYTDSLTGDELPLLESYYKRVLERNDKVMKEQ